jgi:hypothetical protein
MNAVSAAVAMPRPQYCLADPVPELAVSAVVDPAHEVADDLAADRDRPEPSDRVRHDPGPMGEEGLLVAGGIPTIATESGSE